MFRFLSLLLPVFLLSQFIIAQNTNPWPSTGSVGIGTTTPSAQLEVKVPTAMGTTVGSSTEITRFGANSGNYSQLRFLQVRNTAGNDWTGTSTRVQAATDVTPQGYIDFNPVNGLYGLAFGTGQNSQTNTPIEIMRITNNGFVGVGTTAPAALMDVRVMSALGNTVGSSTEVARFGANSGNWTQLRFLVNRTSAGNDWLSATTRIQAVTDGTNLGYMDFNPANGVSGLALGSGSAEYMRILQGGNVLIGKTSQANSSYILDVNGNVRANKVVVNTTGADYVFDTGYALRPLREVEQFVRVNHHLPEVEPAAQMQKEGLDVGDNQTVLLKKIEELTLYVIELQKQVDSLKSQIKP